MTKQNFIILLEKLEQIYTQDHKEDSAWKDFIEVIAPQKYAPIIKGKLSTVLDVLRIEYPYLVSWLYYYFFEAKGMKNPIVSDNGKSYNYGTHEGLVQSMENFGYIK